MSQPDLDASCEVAKDSGFTLIEVLISLFIFTIISVGTMTALTQSLRGKSRLEEAVTRIHTLNSARAILRADISALTLRPLRDELGGQELFSVTTDGEALLTFVRRGRANPGGLEMRGDLERVEYHFIDQKFVRRSFANANISSDPQYFDRTLLSGLEGVVLKAHSPREGVSVTGSISLETKFFRISADGAENSGLEIPTPGALSFEITDEFGETTTHFFELDI